MNSPLPYAVPKKLLFLVHLIVPALLCVFFVDQYLLEETLKPYLQLTATSFLFYLLFFDQPHIIASFVSYADTEYMRHYKRHGVVIALIIVGVYALYTYDFTLLFILYGAYTMWHVIRQQAGITRMFVGKTPFVHHLWYLCAIVMYTAGFFLTFKRAGLSASNEILTIVLHVAFVAFAVVAAIYWSYLSHKSSHGAYYFLCTSLVVCAGYIFLAFEYAFLAIFVLRFVHDTTAFIFYCVHDSNRNHETVRNYIYRATRRVRLPLIITTPIIGISIAYAMQNGIHSIIVVDMLIITLGIIHYYLESFMWKRDSLHRRYILVR